MAKNKQKKQEGVEEIVSPTRLMVRRFKKNKLAMIGLVIFIALVVVILITKIYVELTNYNLANINIKQTYQAPSLEHLFGTDKSGRDYFPRVLLGGYISLQVGVIATLISVVLGVIIGGISGFYGGKVDMFLMRITEIISSFPFIPLAITVSVLFMNVPDQQRLYVMIFIIGILRWPGLARMIRGQILSLREQEFMLACRALGIKNSKQIIRHLLPNTVAYIIVNATTSFASAILSESTLAYLGLSVNEPLATWGGLLSKASSSIIMKSYWWMWIFPGVLLFLLIMSINLIGEGLRDAVDPKAEVKFRTQDEGKKKKWFSRNKKTTEVAPS